MMIKGIGIDIIELDRIKRSLQKSDRFVQRILTEQEKELFLKLTNERRQVEFLAGRFAAKEAFAKATGTGIGKLSFKDISILQSENGKPYIFAKEFERDNLFVSISHSEEYAVAQVIIEEK